MNYWERQEKMGDSWRDIILFACFILLLIFIAGFFKVEQYRQPSIFDSRVSE